ncbi:MAG TPA: hypothetical protein VGO47_08535, partial [Chlamydiales bacterium]|nr:hypothetical protein [Chlamydiales bacterium]
MTFISHIYYAGIAQDPDFKVKLTGSWETLVGQQDTFSKLRLFPKSDARLHYFKYISLNMKITKDTIA